MTEQLLMVMARSHSVSKSFSKLNTEYPPFFFSPLKKSLLEFQILRYSDYFKNLGYTFIPVTVGRAQIRGRLPRSSVANVGKDPVARDDVLHSGKPGKEPHRTPTCPAPWSWSRLTV